MNAALAVTFGVDPPGQRWEGYVHATDELVMIVEGDVEFEIERIRHHPAAGEELLIPAGAVHSVRNLGPTQARWLYGYGQRQSSKMGTSWPMQ